MPNLILIHDIRNYRDSFLMTILNFMVGLIVSTNDVATYPKLVGPIRGQCDSFGNNDPFGQ